MHQYSQGMLACNFLVVSSSGFVISIMLASCNELGNASFLFDFSGRIWKRLTLILLKMFGKTYPLKPSFVGRFLITDSVSLLVMGLFRFPVSLWLSAGGFHVSSNLFMMLAYSFLWYSLIIPFTPVKPGVTFPLSFWF